MTITEEEKGVLKKRMSNVSNSKTFNNIIKEFNLGDKKVLDIGCSYGEFLAKFGVGSVGLTVSVKEVEWGQMNNLNIQIGNIEEGFDTEEKFDVIFANNIFEHMLAPHLFLLKIKKFLKEDGVLILGVPSVPYVFPLIKLRRFSGSLSPAHVNFFTRYTLNKTVEYAGWEIRKSSGYYFTNRFLDFLFNFICPHFYVIATVKKDFHYDEKRQKELQGYNNIFKINNKK
jgi:SAM-dependent methyltransferase